MPHRGTPVAALLVWALLVWAMLLWAPVAGAQEGAWPSPGEHVAIVLLDARELHGVVTGETTERSLSLARTIRGVTAESAIPRAKIAKIEPRPPLELALDEPQEAVPVASSRPRTRRAATAKIQNLTVRARLANWDNDPEPDGLLVQVSPLDGAGNFVPVGGGIDLELYGQRHRLAGHVFDDRESFPLLDRTAQIVRPADAQGEGYVVRLPFRRFHPDRNLEFGPFALVRARFSAAGQGVFEAADDWTVIRDSSRFRDDLEQLTGRRYLSREQTRLQTPFDVRRVSLLR